MAGTLNIPRSGGIDKSTVAATGVVMQMPFRIGYEGKMWLLPIEPLVGFRGRSVISRRLIAKKRSGGSVKEFWNTDDWEINVIGTFINPEEKVPDEFIARLTGYHTAKKPVVIECAIADALGIRMAVIESLDFPPTAGIQNQDFSIRLISDEDFDLFI